MKLVLFLSFVLMLPFAGCQRDKMNSKNLTTVNVKEAFRPLFRETPSPLTPSGKTPREITITQRLHQT